MKLMQVNAEQQDSQMNSYAERLGILVQRHHAELALVAAKQDAEQSAKVAHSAMLEAQAGSRTKSHFLATMSHELRTPLNAIIGFSELMAAGHLGPDQIDKYQEYAQDICDSGRHLLELINDILDLAKIEAGKLELNEDRVRFGEVVESCLKLVEGRAREADVTIHENIPRSLPNLLIDERKFKQILVNLLSNAVKFTPTGGVIVLDACLASDGGIVVTVTDTGTGIRPEDLERVLEPFTQADDPYTRQFEGTGLGLPLSKSLVELHGGTLSLESEIGVGTRVTVRLPSDRVEMMAA